MSAQICVIGSGYVGLTTAACFAHLGHHVVCTDIDAPRVDRLIAGECPILEQGLDNLLREGLAGGRLTLHHRQRGGGRRRVRLPLRADAPGRRRLRRPVLHRGGGRPDRPGARGRHRGHQQVDRPGRLHPRGRAGARSQRRARRLQPRVPPRGLGGARLPEPRPHRHRRRRPIRGRAGRRALPRHRRSADRHRPAVGRDDQVRRPTPSSPPRSASSTPSRPCARPWAPT